MSEGLRERACERERESLKSAAHLAAADTHPRTPGVELFSLKARLISTAHLIAQFVNSDSR